MAQTILVIDDTVKILEIVKIFLEREGYQVLSATDPREGIKVAQANHVDLLLLDIMMPGMDGYTVFDNLKADKRTRDIPVIMMTAKAVVMHTPKEFFYGLYGFISKPFSKDQLLQTVRAILRMTEAGSDSAVIESVDDSEILGADSEVS